MEEGWLPNIKAVGSHPHPPQGFDTDQSTPQRVVLISSYFQPFLFFFRFLFFPFFSCVCVCVYLIK